MSKNKNTDTTAESLLKPHARHLKSFEAKCVFDYGVMSSRQLEQLQRRTLNRQNKEAKELHANVAQLSTEALRRSWALKHEKNRLRLVHLDVALNKARAKEKLQAEEKHRQWMAKLSHVRFPEIFPEFKEACLHSTAEFPGFERFKSAFVHQGLISAFEKHNSGVAGFFLHSLEIDIEKTSFVRLPTLYDQLSVLMGINPKAIGLIQGRSFRFADDLYRISLCKDHQGKLEYYSGSWTFSDAQCVAALESMNETFDAIVDVETLEVFIRPWRECMPMAEGVFMEAALKRRGERMACPPCAAWEPPVFLTNEQVWQETFSVEDVIAPPQDKAKAAIRKSTSLQSVWSRIKRLFPNAKRLIESGERMG